MSILVTGAGGFLGRHLVRHLESTSSEPIVATVHHKTGLWDSPAQKVVVDLTKPDEVSQLVQSIRLSEVYHLAGHSRVTSDLKMPDYFGVNYLTTVYLTDALTALTQNVRLFLASTIHVYGNISDTAFEETPPAPINDYGFTKFIAEEYVRHSVADHPKISATVGRLYSCFGPGQAPGFVSSDLCLKIARLPEGVESELSVGPISTYRRFLDVRDAVKLLPMLVAAPNPDRFQLVNIASPYQVQIKELIELLLSISKKRAIVKSSEDNSKNRLFGIQVNCDRLKKLLPEIHFRPIEETLRDMYRLETRT